MAGPISFAPSRRMAGRNPVHTLSTQTMETVMKKILSALAVTATVFASGAAFAQVSTNNPGNTNRAERDALMKERGMMVRVYDRSGKVYYEGQPRYMRKAKDGVGVYFPAFTNPVDEKYFDTPDSTERSEK
jgi:hypothetical protein